MHSLFLMGIFALYATTLTRCASVTRKDARNASTNEHAPLSLKHQQKGFEIVTRAAKIFSHNFFMDAARFDPESEVLSPLSFFLPLSMLAYGIRDSERYRILSAVGLSDNETKTAKSGYKILIDKLSTHNIRMRIKLYYSDQLEVRPSFVKLAAGIFKADIEPVTVDKGYIDRKIINEWIMKQTDNRGAPLFGDYERIGPKPNIVLASTVYFKGIWGASFDRSLTTNRPFFIYGRVAENVPTMHKVARMPYGRLEALGASFVELPFASNSADDAMSMFVIRPDHSEGMNGLVEKLAAFRLEDLLDTQPRNVSLYLPKFTHDFSEVFYTRFDEIFRDVNPFRQAFAFRNIIRSAYPMSFGMSVMKFVIEIDEEGVASAGSTGTFYKDQTLEGSLRAVRSVEDSGVVEFVLDRPFVAIIALKGNLFLDIFSININGFTFIRPMTSHAQN